MIGGVKERVLRKRKPKVEVPEPSVTLKKREYKSTAKEVKLKSEQLSGKSKKPSLSDSLKKINEVDSDGNNGFIAAALLLLNEKA